MRPAAIAALLLSTSLARADLYDQTCPSPEPSGRAWFIDAKRGSTPDAAHGGIAVGGVMGMADGSAEHPFNSLAALLHGGPYESPAIPGYGRPLLSTAPWDHYPKTGVNGQRKDNDWNPSKPDPTRVNPGDSVVVFDGDYGALSVGYYGQGTYNVDADGKTKFVSIVAAADATVSTIGVSGARGFLIDGLKVRSQGPLSAILVNVTGAAAVPQRDIVLANLNIESFDDQADLDRAYKDYLASTPDNPPKDEQAFMAANFKRGVFIGGDNLAGSNNQCVAVLGSHLHNLYTGFGLQGASKVLIEANRIDHFTGDGINLLLSHVRVALNQFTDAQDDATGAHPDIAQSQWSGQFSPKDYHDVVIDRNIGIERLDPNLKFPNHVTFAQVSAASGLVITGNATQTSNCPGIALGDDTRGAYVANNTIVGNGQIPMPGCAAVQSGEVKADNNTWENNVTAGRFYQACNHSVWRNNIQIPSRQGGVSAPGALSYCKDGVIAYTSQAGDYNGIKVVPTDAPDFAFTYYNPPASGFSGVGDPNLHPVCNGPLTSCTAHIGALKAQ